MVCREKFLMVSEFPGSGGADHTSDSSGVRLPPGEAEGESVLLGPRDMGHLLPAQVGGEAVRL